MKNFILAAVLGVFGLMTAVHAEHSAGDTGHQHHPKHNMIIFGENELFLSHIVYKVPHNYQVLLKVKLPDNALAAYRESRKNSPQNLMIFLLDSNDISQIEKATSLNGTLFSEDSEGNRTEVLSGIEILKNNFELLFFNELPLNLSTAKSS